MTLELERRIREYVKAGLGGALVIPGNDAGPKPRAAIFATLLLIGDEVIGGAAVATAATAGSTTTAHRQQRRATYSVRVFNERDAGSQLLRWIDSDLGLLAEQRGGFRIGPKVTLRQLDALIDDSYEHQVALDLPVDYHEALNQDTGRVDYATVELDFGGQGAIAVTIDLER